MKHQISISHCFCIVSSSSVAYLCLFSFCSQWLRTLSHLWLSMCHASTPGKPRGCQSCSSGSVSTSAAAASSSLSRGSHPGCSGGESLGFGVSGGGTTVGPGSVGNSGDCVGSMSFLSGSLTGDGCSRPGLGSYGRRGSPSFVGGAGSSTGVSKR